MLSPWAGKETTKPPTNSKVQPQHEFLVTGTLVYWTSRHTRSSAVAVIADRTACSSTVG